MTLATTNLLPASCQRCGQMVPALDSGPAASGANQLCAQCLQLLVSPAPAKESEEQARITHEGWLRLAAMPVATLLAPYLKESPLGALLDKGCELLHGIGHAFSFGAPLWVASGGILGEICLSLLLAAAFYLNLPRGTGWKVARVAVLILGIYCLTRSYLFWEAAFSQYDVVPIGQLHGAIGDGLSDFQRLVNEFQWDAGRASSSFLALTRSALAILWLQYLGCTAQLTGSKKPSE